MSAPFDKIKVIIADDHELYRDGLKLMLKKMDDIDVIAEAQNGRELVSLVTSLKPDVVITDIKMPVMDGIEAARQITEISPLIGVIALSMFDEEQLILEMLDAGALGYLVKNSDKYELIDAIHAVFMHKEYYCNHTSAKLARIIAGNRHPKYKIRKDEVEFSAREIEIIQLICAENTTKEIAEKLSYSIRTVEGIRVAILDKMDVKNSVGLVIQAIRMGIYNPGLIENK